MDNLKPIETVYNGYKFRSRLEARWAVFFDALGVNYEYEPEGFELSNGDKYLPDFYLPELETFVEVKPENFTIEMDDEGVIFPTNWDKYGYAAQDILNSGSNYWIVCGEPKKAITEMKNYLFCNVFCVYHAISQVKDWDVEPVCGVVKCSECSKYKIAACTQVLMIVKARNAWQMFTTLEDLYNNKILPFKVQIADFTNEAKKQAQEGFTKTEKAFTKARQARFEHGECG